VRKIVWSSPELLLETGRADVSIRGAWAAGTAVGGHALSFCAGPSPCTRAREMLTSTATMVRDETTIGNLRHSVIQGHPHFSLHSHHRRASVANAGASGDTAAMGLARFNRSITDDTDAVILELGANDMLRGFELKRAALAAILRDLEARRTALWPCYCN